MPSVLAIFFIFLKYIFFGRGVYLVTGVFWKNVRLFVFLMGCGVSGSHLSQMGGGG